MEKEITLSSFSVKGTPGNRPGDFTSNFYPTLDLQGEYYLAFDRIISMAFFWTNINSGYDNQKIAFSNDGGKTFTDIAQGVWDYRDLDHYIKEKTKTVDSDGKDVYPITLTFDEPTFRVLIILEKEYQLDLTKSNFNRLIGYTREILKDERNVGSTTPNISEDTDVLNIHCDLISESLVDGEESDIIFSFGKGTLQSPYNFVLEPRRVIFNPINKTHISSIRIYVTDGLRRPVYLNHADTAFSLILKPKVPIEKKFIKRKYMHSRDFKKIYHPKLGRYVYMHRGNGLIVDNIMKPLRRGAKEVGKKVVAPFLKKKAKQGLSKAASKAGSKAIEKLSRIAASEKSGDLIRERLKDVTQRQMSRMTEKGPPKKKSQRDVNPLLNNLIAMS